MTPPVPRLVAWELTRRCNLRCRHCRASAGNGPYADELDLDEAKAFIDDLASFAKPILILTGGEPLLCGHLWDVIAHARAHGLTPVVGTNATGLDDRTAVRLAAAGIRRISVSLDFPTASAHDAFRGVTGAFDAAVRGIRAARAAGVEVQVNSTITRLNRTLLPELHDLACRLDAQAFHPFLLVPTGRGAELAGTELSPEEYDEALAWVARAARTSPLALKPTDAPQYQRILREHCAATGCALPSAGHGFGAMTRGCLAGTGFAFVSHTGDVQPCGYFDLQVGNIRRQPFSEIWRTSPVLDDLRHPERLKGKCGACGYRNVCGGCRARALAVTGDYLAEEPYCVHVPERTALAFAQADFPIAARPYAALAQAHGGSAARWHQALLNLRTEGKIRRVGATFDAARLGFDSTLVAFAVPEARLDEAAAIVSACRAVTHNYARGGCAFNLWFTLVARGRDAIASLVAELRLATKAEAALELPATRRYKLRTDFSGLSAQESAAVPPCATTGRAFDETDPADGALLRKLQGDILDLGLEPFSDAECRRLAELKANGTVRRFGAIANHRAVGFVSNALLAWRVPDERLDAAGAALAAAAPVSHAYAREPQDGWPSNLYAMVHARSEDELAIAVRDLAAAVAREAGSPCEPLVLPTRREYKKVSMMYPSFHPRRDLI